MVMGGAGMHNNIFTRVLALGAFAALCLCAAGAGAAELNTAAFLAACSADASVTEDPAFDEGKVTPKAYGECVAGELAKNNLGQKDVDMLTKMHKEEIGDADVESYPTLEDLLNKNEGFEDSCRKTLGMPTDSGTDMEEEPEDQGMPDEAPAEDDGSPPE
jgi:hypothetical protein